MKNLLKTAVCAIVVFTVYTCTTEPAELIQEETNTVVFTEPENQEVTNSLPPSCSNQDPQSKLINNSLLTADMEVFDTFGILMTHAYGVPAGTESPVLSFPDGVTTFVISTSQSSKTIQIDMTDCTIYQVTIDENNQLDTDVPTAL